MWAGWLLMCIPLQARASGGGVVLLLPFALLLLSATPALDLLRRRAWTMALLYAVALPMIWALSAGFGYAAGQMVAATVPTAIATVSIAVGVLSLTGGCWLCWRDLVARHRGAVSGLATRGPAQAPSDLQGAAATSKLPAVSMLVAVRWLLGLVLVGHGLLVLGAQAKLWLAMGAPTPSIARAADWGGWLAALLQVGTGVLLWKRKPMVVWVLLAWTAVVCYPFGANPSHWSAVAALHVPTLAEQLSVYVLLGLLWIKRTLR